MFLHRRLWVEATRRQFLMAMHFASLVDPCTLVYRLCRVLAKKQLKALTLWKSDPWSATEGSDTCTDTLSKYCLHHWCLPAQILVTHPVFQNMLSTCLILVFGQFLPLSFTCNFVATTKCLWEADEMPWLACWLFFERGVPDFFEVVEHYEDEIHEDKIQPKMSTLTLSFQFGLTYETKRNITATLDCVQTMFVPDTSNQFGKWAIVWDHM